MNIQDIMKDNNCTEQEAQDIYDREIDSAIQRIENERQ